MKSYLDWACFSSSPVTKRFLLLFFPVSIICIVGAISLFYAELEKDITKLRSSNREIVNVGVGIIGNEIRSVVKELAFVAQQKKLLEVLSSEPNFPQVQGKIGDLLADWKVIVQTNGVYDQIRWLDMSGQEKLRVNFNDGRPSAVASQHLQNKSNRYYFQDTIKLEHGEIFISPFDLNIENGAIENPRKPVIRVGTPVFNKQGEKKGVILINFLGQSMLDKLDKMMISAGSNAWMLNSDGYWLKGSQEALEWGFMYAKPKNSIQHFYPDAWKIIKGSKQGQFEDEKGLWSYATVYPIIEKASNRLNSSLVDKNIATGNIFWKVVLFLPRAEYSTLMWKTGLNISLTTMILLLFLLWGSWRLANAWIREKNAEELLRQVNLNLEQRIENRTIQLRNEIAERRKIELELREREERFRSITTTSSVAMFITIDQHGKIITWNPTAEKTFGYMQDEVLGKSLTQFMPERYREAHEKGIARVVQSNEYRLIGKTVEVYGLKRNGEEFPIELSLGSWRQKNTRYFSAVIHDITERKQAEKQLQYLATHDNLTGLPNRSLGIDRLNHALVAAERNHTQVAVMNLL